MMLLFKNITAFWEKHFDVSEKTSQPFGENISMFQVNTTAFYREYCGLFFANISVLY